MAVIAKQRYKLDIAPKGGWAIVYASQHDDGAREIEFAITNQGNAFSIPASINVSVQGIKSNGSYFSHSCSYSGNIVTMALADDMTDIVGKSICVLKFTNSSQQKLATAKFVLNVDTDSSSEGVIIDTEAEEIFNQMLNKIRAQAASVSADIAELQSMVGSPLVASTASAMTDHNKIYVYTGSQSGYTNGNWYYWNGSAWASGGVYNSTAFETDKTLSVENMAADAKVVGDNLANVNDFEKSTFKNPITFSRLTSYSMWTFGQEVVEGTGANATNNKASRTTYVSFDEPVLISLDNSDYNFVVWVYSSQSISGALYSPIKTYTNKPLIILPKASTSYFRIGVKRVDGSVLTTDYSDTSSDAYKILNSLHTYTLTAQTLDVDNIPLNAKAVTDNALVFKRYLDDNADLNSAVSSGVYILLSSRNYTNSPISVGYLFVYRIETVIMQVAYPLGTTEAFLPSVYIRYGSGSSSSISSVWKMLGRGRKTSIKMACFGDSIMYGQNGDSSSRVEEQYRIPSIIAYNLNIETTNYGVGSQGYLGLITETAYDNISSKDLTQFNAMLMCYGVNDGYKNLGTWDSTDETTIMGQFNKIIAYVFSQNPSIRLIVVAPYNGRNVGSFPKYWYGERSHPDGYVSRQVLSDTLKQACEYYNIPYIEQKNSPINGYTIQTLIGTDGVHPSLEGYFQLGAWLSGEVGKLIG